MFTANRVKCVCEVFSSARCTRKTTMPPKVLTPPKKKPPTTHLLWAAGLAVRIWWEQSRLRSSTKLSVLLPRRVCHTDQDYRATTITRTSPPNRQKYVPAGSSLRFSVASVVSAGSVVDSTTFPNKSLTINRSSWLDSW